MHTINWYAFDRRFPGIPMKEINRLSRVAGNWASYSCN